MSAATIQDEVLALPANDRIKLIDVLWESLSSPEMKIRETVWAAESERRIEAFEGGRLVAHDAQPVFAGLRKKLNK